MKRIGLSIIGGSLFIAGYYHVHHQMAHLGPKQPQTSFVAPAASTPTSSLFSFKTAPAFAFSN